MQLNHDACYSALLSRDSRFDGRFFVGVSSTGIYCRPVCRVRTPRAANTTFFNTAAAAEQAGYRPCLRCRPELAPGYAPLDSGHTLAGAARELIDKGLLDGRSLEFLAARLGISSRYLRTIFQREFGVTPGAYNQSRRLLLAKQLLTDTPLGLSDIALAAGFSSQHRLHAMFRQRYHMPPSRFRKQQGRADTGAFTIALGYRPPYAWDAVLTFLGARAISGLEDVTATGYRRVLRCTDRNGNTRTGWMEVRHLPARHRLSITLAHTLLPQLSWLRNRLTHCFDLSLDPLELAQFFSAINDWKPGTRIPGSMDSFETGVRTIIGQQITVQAARKILHRFCARFADPVDTPWPALNRAFPAADTIAALRPEQIAELGVIRQRAAAIIHLAQQLVAEPGLLEPGLDAGQQIERLLAIPGVGDWTAHCIALRALSWPDAFPAGDAGVLAALAAMLGRRISVPEARQLALQWRPWRGYMTVHLWQRAASPPAPLPSPRALTPALQRTAP